MPVLSLVLSLALTTSGSPVAAGYQEVVLSVSDLARDVEFFETVAGWRVRYQGPVSRERLVRFGLDERWSAREAVLGNADQPRGWVRLIQFSGGEQVQIRSNAQAWDTGGWFDFNVRVLDMDAKFQEMQARGWQAPTDPVQFDFGRFEVKEWLARGPDGVVIALIERIRPALEGWDDLQHFSRAFNATQIVSDFDAAIAFYRNVLGFQTYLEHEGPSRAPGPNVLGLPHNLAAAVPRRVAILHPEGINEGSVEILAFDGVTGADFSDRAMAPNLGILSLRFPVHDVASFVEHVEAHAMEIVRAPSDVMIPELGEITILTLRGPDGAELEFYAPRDGTAP